jgi:hypothetical protein
MTYDKNTIVAAARQGVITVRFTKKNGDERIMKCTLLSEYLPQQKDVEEATTMDNPNLIAVWDVEANGWRSFRIDSVISLNG